MIDWSRHKMAEALRCVTKNVADIIGDTGRGKLKAGRKVDFIVLDSKEEVL